MLNSSFWTNEIEYCNTAFTLKVPKNRDKVSIGRHFSEIFPFDIIWRFYDDGLIIFEERC